MPANYPFKEIEPKWQKFWEEQKLFLASEPPKKKYMVMPMFIYPSGDIHMGHFRNYTITDALARKKMMEGYDVMHPFGFDAFGLPAENAAIKLGIHPEEWTLKNVDTSRKTLKRIGISFDWTREVVTCLPDYYKWTEWMFLLMYKRGLAYRAMGKVNWCPKDKTVLANEQVVGGLCWRCDTPVETKELEQWYFKITAYAERLLADIDKLEGWPEGLKTMQRNWIGKSVGLEIQFTSENGVPLTVFTTRPDTVFGATFMVLAPEHTVLEKLPIPAEKKAEVKAYQEKAKRKSDIERTSLEREKDGVFTGAFAVNPLNGEKIPIWIADYVLATYGTGMIMAVPAHDERDFEFAKKYNLPIRPVIAPMEGNVELPYTYTEKAKLINSGNFSELPCEAGWQKIADKVEAEGKGRRKTEYRLRDWLISRQRYWGSPIPVVHCPKDGIVPVSEDQLPVLLPKKVKSFIPEGRSPLADVPEYINTTCPKCHGPAKRDPDTMDTFLCSSWYFLRYTDPKNEKAPFEPAKANRWLPIDNYVGGIEHATGHLLYFRFFTKVLKDAGYVNFDEPALNLFNHGMVLDAQGRVMSKSLGNTVSPIEEIQKEGADVLRLAMFFAAPGDKEMLWTTDGILGQSRFLSRFWRLAQELKDYFKAPLHYKVDMHTSSEYDRALYKKLNWAIKKATDDYADYQFNTVISAVMELLNAFGEVPKDSKVAHYALSKATQLLAPVAPHFCEEVWQILGHKPSIFHSGWPAHDQQALEETIMTLAVQINGRLRHTVTLPKTMPEPEILKHLQELPKLAPHFEGKSVVKSIYVPEKLINVVVR
ncbi:MAG TPA: leucine--tRNA ligase [Verrucomicrobiae bacterium]|nr:leucine--tRNA ligase [Verrucomicrobiae bacterium]